jgi:parvulin-like peptidyl-prolyl isomerase
MTDKEQPQEPEKTVYQRDKTAKEPKVAERPEGEQPKRPVVKPRKVFQAKKVKIQTKKPLEHRVRHIRMSSEEAANLIRQTLLDFQMELAEEPTDDPDKEYQDYEKIEKFFARLARKYSVCTTKAVGGDLEWIYPKMPELEGILTEDLRDAILKCEKFMIPEPIQSKFGHRGRTGKTRPALRSPGRQRRPPRPGPARKYGYSFIRRVLKRDPLKS